ncbi:Rha family phage regulatory protein [Pseudomonas sp. JUb42]|uniref:Rha family transcriptional regulator n=1 Tax=Pseudomonas sp. JUb42 TaxID=2940611 RepID=UPI002166E9B7|nr:Rha family transcriptional regulator [Pseudomonas sp. JUb42]MCS3473062.1 Rha family phage regulatory protein [Pseudomonas sp. JUb42]
MNTSIARTPDQPADNVQVLVEVVKGLAMTTSLDVATHFNKRHDNVIKAIRALEIPDDLRRLNFEETFREVAGPQGAKRKEAFVLMTRDGFSLLCMGFTGKEAMRWKVAYINAFNQMEQALKSPPLQPDNRALLAFAIKTLELMRHHAHAQQPKLGTEQLVQSYLNIPSLDQATADQISLALTFVQGQIIGESSAAMHLPNVAGSSIAKDLLYGLLRSSHDAELIFNAMYDSGVEKLASEAFRNHMATSLANTSKHARDLLGYVASFAIRDPYRTSRPAKDSATH